MPAAWRVHCPAKLRQHMNRMQDKLTQLLLLNCMLRLQSPMRQAAPLHSFCMTMPHGPDALADQLHMFLMLLLLLAVIE